MRLRLLIKGTVQGVGFRPCVYQLAKQLQLTGFVFNQGSGVLIEIQGRQAPAFVTQLQQSLPVLAEIDDIASEPLPEQMAESGFEIKESLQTPAKVLIAPDTDICRECLAELFDSNSRYYQYPFVNCTQCGPRFSITEKLPYDRGHTTMASFVLCCQCHKEYLDPDNRRHHAQPTACSQCGPNYQVTLAEMARCLIVGEIVAIKGLGGYQLVCDAFNQQAIARLRQIKARPDKPLAIMVNNLQQAKQYVEINQAESKVLCSSARPIVLLKRINDLLPRQLAPSLNQLGVMLPSTPMHHLLFKMLAQQGIEAPVLVVTSANQGGCPMIVDDHLAHIKLKEMADAVIGHNREIAIGVDDSVVKVIDGFPVFIRRARGYVPKPIKLAKTLPPILALGAHQKNTICIIREDEAFVSQHIGNLSSPASIDFFDETIAHWLKLLNVEPQYLAHDCHPDFYSSQWASLQPLPSFAIQHHHAHLGAVLAEHGMTEPCLGLALDGYGYGDEGQAWGGELMYLEEGGYQHLGQLQPLPLVGGEQVIKAPWRMAAAILHQLGRSETILSRFGQFSLAKSVVRLLDSTPRALVSTTSSCGRLFDAAAALLGVCLQSSYEGQAAMQLEGLVTKPEVMVDGWQQVKKNLSLWPLLERLADCQPPQHGANLFHGTLIAALSDWIAYHCQKKGCYQVALAGGCLSNSVLVSGLTKTLKQQGITAYLPQQVPANDGGLSLGQAWLSAYQAERV